MRLHAVQLPNNLRPPHEVSDCPSSQTLQDILQLGEMLPPESTEVCRFRWFKLAMAIQGLHTQPRSAAFPTSVAGSSLSLTSDGPPITTRVGVLSGRYKQGSTLHVSTVSAAMHPMSQP